MIDSIFLSTALILGITIFISFLVHILRQPLIISYIITGIIVGPVFLNLLHSGQEYFQIFAEFGVILLLFLVGLSLNFHFLKKIGKVSTVTGLGQILFTAFFGFLILNSLGFDNKPALYLAIALTFSSTIIITKMLLEKRESETVYGRYTMGLMLVQDIVAISILILLPAFQKNENLFLAIFLVIFKSAIFLIFVYALSRLILKLLDKAAESGEFLLIFTIAWCFSIAGLAKWSGLSLEIGAIIAGISLGSSVYQAEISSRIRPLRDFFIVLFFIILGSEMQVNSLETIIVPGIILTLFVLIGNPLILYVLFRSMKFTRRISFKIGLTAAQVSEFGFVFLFVVAKENCIDKNIIPLFTFIALTTIFSSSYLITYSEEIYKKIRPLFNIFGKDKYKTPEEEKRQYDVLVFGYHRLGWKICETLKEMNISFAVVDFDPRAIKKLKERDIPYYFGDATDVELLSEIPLGKTKMIISTMPSTHSQLTMIKNVRENYPKPIIITTLSYSRFLQEMYDAGADYVMLPHLVCGNWLDSILKNESWNRRTMKKLIREQNEQRKLKFNLPLKKNVKKNNKE